MRITNLVTVDQRRFAPRGGKAVDTLVLHYTSTEGLSRTSDGPHGLRLIKRSSEAHGISAAELGGLARRYEGGARCTDAAMLCLINSANQTRAASWHYCIASMPEIVAPPLGRASGVEIVKYVDPGNQAHHVGALGLSTNLRSIGIECCYPGPAPRKECRSLMEAVVWYSARGWKGAVSQMRGPDDVLRYYHEQPKEQLEALRSLCLMLCDQFKSIVAICSHYKFAPKKRIDPDPPINLAELRSWLSARLGRAIVDRPPRSSSG